MPWIYLLIAGLFEMLWAVALKYTEGLSRFWPSLFTAGAMAVSLYFLALAVRTLPVGTAYAVWTGIGAVGAAVVGMVIWGESHAPLRIASIALIVAGIAGLRLTAA